MSDPRASVARFQVDGSGDVVEVVEVDGCDELSRPFSYDVVVKAGVASSDALIGRQGLLTMDGPGGRTQRRGVISELEEVGDGGSEMRVRLRLVPTLAQLGLSRRSRFFQRMTIPEIVEHCLSSLEGCVLRLQLSADYPRRTMVTQYDESDLDFLSRLMEHVGICYYFQHEDDGQILVITDDTTSMDDAVLRLDVEQVSRFARQLPREVQLTDFSEENPHVPLESSAIVDEAGVGVVSEANAGFESPAEGSRLARVRAEELRCRRVEVCGRGRGLAVNAGQRVVFSGENVPAGMSERALLVLRARCSYKVGPAGGEHRFELDALSSAVPFRPHRRTPRPRVLGALSARTAGLGSEADMDERGRYRVQLPFDEDGGERSSYLRMAQPWAGRTQGMHFPLEAGAEVLWSCINGDPDRPVITGAVPNALSLPLASGKNRSSVIRARSGASVEFGYEVTPKSVSFPLTEGEETTPALEQRQQIDWEPPDDGTTLAGTVDATEDDANKWYKVKVPNYDPEGHDCYRRMGRADTSEPAEAEFAALPIGGSGGGDRTFALSDGTFDYTDGNRVEMTALNRNVIIGGKSRFAIGAGGMGVWDAGTCFYSHSRKVGESFGADMWRSTTVDNGASDSYTYGDNESFSAGFSFSARLGLDAGVFIGGKLDLSLALKFEASASISSSFTAGISWSESKAGTVGVAPTAETSAQTSNKLNIKPVQATLATKVVPAFAAVGGFLTAGLATGLAFGMTQSEDAANAVPIGIGTGLTAGLLTAFSAATLAKYALIKASPPVTEIALSPMDITIGMAKGPPTLPGFKVSTSALLMSHNPASFIQVTATGVTITAPKITLNATAAVDVNAGVMNLNSKGTLTAKATGLATFESQAQTILKSAGSMTINTQVGVAKGNWIAG